MYMHRVQHQREVTEYQQIMEKIRHVKMRVNSKCHELKQWQMGMEEEENKKTVFMGLNQPISELRKGTELLEKGSVKIR